MAAMFEAYIANLGVDHLILKLAARRSEASIGWLSRAVELFRR